MDECARMSRLSEKKAAPAGLIARLLGLLTGQKKHRSPFLDPRTTPDHLKRDLGLLDGRGDGVRRR